MDQCLFHFNESKHLIEKDPKTVWLFTRNYEKNQKNIEKLVDSLKDLGQPVARLQCKWFSNQCQGKGNVIRYHFKEASNLVLQTDLCVDTTVALSGINIVPEAGLYNGARGSIVDITYDTVVGPNDKHGEHLPKYIVVDFPGLRLGNAKPWDKNNPTVSLVQCNQ